MSVLLKIVTMCCADKNHGSVVNEAISLQAEDYNSFKFNLETLLGKNP